MRIRIALVGRLREKYLRAGVAEYLKRLQPYARTELQELDAPPPPAPGVFTIALDINGEGLSSEAFARLLARLGLEGRPNVTFLIGGAEGLDAAVLAAADMRLSLGPMTLPHQVAVLVLAEQIYRAFRINAGEPYHK